MSASPRILMIAPAVPSDRGNGLAMRLGLFLEAFSRVGEVDLAIIPAAGDIDAPRDFVSRLNINELDLATLARETLFVLKTMSGDPGDRLKAFQEYRRPSLAAWATPQTAAKIAKCASGPYDLLHVSRLYLAGLADVMPAPIRTLDLDEDDASSCLSEARLLHSGSFGAAWMELEAAGFDQVLASEAGRFIRLWIASKADAMQVTERHPSLHLAVAANAVAIPEPVPVERDGSRTVLFVGALDYPPNRDGVDWFVRKVWPSVIGSEGKANLTIIGRGAEDAATLWAGASISVPGFVLDLSDAYRHAAVVIAPMRSGGGTRIKILEAAAHGVPVVATSAALAGLDLPPGSCWQADEASDFARAVLDALRNPAARSMRASVAAAFVADRHDRNKVVAGLAEEVKQLLARGRT